MTCESVVQRNGGQGESGVQKKVPFHYVLGVPSRRRSRNVRHGGDREQRGAGLEKLSPELLALRDLLRTPLRLVEKRASTCTSVRRLLEKYDVPMSDDLATEPRFQASLYEERIEPGEGRSAPHLGAAPPGLAGPAVRVLACAPRTPDHAPLRLTPCQAKQAIDSLRG